jgi:hypothetical protein
MLACLVWGSGRVGGGGCGGARAGVRRSARGVGWMVGCWVSRVGRGLRVGGLGWVWVGPG